VSVRAVARVWELSTAKGGELLVLLAIADYAEDDGRHAWPTVLKLAAKSRMSERGVRDVLRRLEHLGELAIEKNTTGRRVRDGHRPRAFMHVLCCADQPAKIAGSQPAEIAGSTGKDCRRKFERNRQNHVRRTGRITYDEPAESRTSLIRDPLVDPLVRTHACAREDTLAQFDELAAVYPRKDRQMAARRAWVALHPTLDLGAFIVAHVRMRVRAEWQQVPVRFVPLLVRFLGERRWEERATAAVEPDAPAVDWFEECKRLHNLACGERLHHHHRMLRDADQAVPAVATPVDEGTADPSRKSAS